MHLVRAWSSGKLPRVRLHEIFPGIEKCSIVSVRKPESRTIGWSLDLQELIHILSVAKCTNAKRILEIGTFDGFTALNLAANLGDGGEVCTLDLPQDGQVGSEAISNACDSKIVGSKFRGEKEVKQIRQLWADSTTADWKEFGSPFDLILIDGCHDYPYVKSDSANAIKHVRPGGTIIWHDYGQFVDVSRAVDEFAHDYQIVAIIGTRLACYRSPDTDASPNVLMGDESQIFLATADRSSPPRLVVRGGDMVSFGAGQLFFRQLGGKANYLARVQEDGSGLTRILDSRIVEISGVSPDGEWATVTDIGSVPGNFAVAVRDRAQRRICAAACVVQWSADGKYMYVALTSRFSAPTGKHTYIIRIPHGFRLLDLPASGIDRASEAELAGIQSIPQGDMSPGPDPQTYAFTNTTFQGNLFRIPLH
jgi:hypothetical protein